MSSPVSPRLPPPAAALHRHLFLRSVRARHSPLTTALAQEMVACVEDPVHVLACWWIALKFEEVEDATFFLASGLLREFPVADVRTLVEAEGEILLSHLPGGRFCIPHQTRVKAIREALQSADYDGWLHALLLCRMDHLFDASTWVVLLRAVHAGTSVAPVFQLLLDMLPSRLRRRLGATPPSPRLTCRSAKRRPLTSPEGRTKKMAV